MRKKCCLILPYLGKFNNYFNLFLESFSSNNSFDLLIFTDVDYKGNIPDNVKFVQFSLEEIKKEIEQKIGMEVSLNNAYKLCDFKPTYGLIFEDYLQGYDYWGHCDCDLLFGDLEKLLLPLLTDNKYDKLFAAGHLTLYKNTETNNRLFMSTYKGEYIYKKALTSDEIYVFDEDFKENNVHRIFIEQGKKVHDIDYSMNPTSRKARFIRSYYSPETKGFKWENQSICRRYYWDRKSIVGLEIINRKIVKTEYLYLHLQSRIMTGTDKICNCKYVEILPDKFKKVNALPSTPQEMQLYKLHLPNKYWIRVLKRRILKKINRLCKA